MNSNHQHLYLDCNRKSVGTQYFFIPIYWFMRIPNKHEINTLILLMTVKYNIIGTILRLSFK